MSDLKPTNKPKKRSGTRRSKKVMPMPQTKKDDLYEIFIEKIGLPEDMQYMLSDSHPHVDENKTPAIIFSWVMPTQKVLDEITISSTVNSASRKVIEKSSIRRLQMYQTALSLSRQVPKRYDMDSLPLKDPVVQAARKFIVENAPHLDTAERIKRARQLAFQYYQSCMEEITRDAMLVVIFDANNFSDEFEKEAIETNIYEVQSEDVDEEFQEDDEFSELDSILPSWSDTSLMEFFYETPRNRKNEIELRLEVILNFLMAVNKSDDEDFANDFQSKLTNFTNEIMTSMEKIQLSDVGV